MSFCRVKSSAAGDDRGSIAPLVAVVVGLGFAMALVVGGAGMVLQRKAHAQAAADAVALAAAAEGIDSAQQVAIANDVTIISTERLVRSGDVIHVVVVDFAGFSSTAAALLAEN